MEKPGKNTENQRSDSKPILHYVQKNRCMKKASVTKKDETTRLLGMNYKYRRIKSKVDQIF